MKITANNYFTAIDSVDVDAMPEALKTMHNLFTKVTGNGQNMDSYKSNANIVKHVELYIDKLNQWADKQQAAEDKKAPARPKVRKTQSARKTGRKAKPRRRKTAAPAAEPKPAKTRKPKAAKAPKAPKPEPAPDNRTRIEKVPVSVAYINRYRLMNGKVLPKKEGRGSIRSFITSLQKAIEEKMIRKTDQYASEIMTMQKSLVDTYNGWKGNAARKIEIENYDHYLSIVQQYVIAPFTVLVKRFLKIQGKDGVKKEAGNLVKAINKFVEAKEVTKAQVADMLDSLNDYIADKTNSVTISTHALNGLMGLAGINGGTAPKKAAGRSASAEPATKNNVNGFEQTFQDPDKSIREGDFVETPMGDKGTVRRLTKQHAFLDTDSGSHTVPRHMIRKVRQGAGVNGVGVINSMDLKVMQFDSLGMQGKYRELIGDPAEPWSMMIYGAPGSGKSTLSIELAHYLAANHGRRVAYVAKEEGIGATIQEKFARLNAFHANIDIHSNRLPDHPEQYQYIFIDSVNEFGIEYEQLSALQHTWKAKGINPVYIFKGTKDGSFRGSQEFEHLVDVSVKTEDGIARTEKSRFGGKGALVVYKDDAQNIPKFSDLIKAEGYRNKAKGKMHITLGEDGKYWVITPAMADLMRAQGFEIF
jgi:hypothetical protein